MVDEVLTIEQAAKLLKLSTQTVRALLKRGELPGRRVGKQWRMTRRALLDYVDGKDATNRPETSGESAPD